MVFSSVPLYLDPPNWQHQHPNQQLQGNGTANHEINQHHLNNIPPPPLPQPPPHHQVVGLGGGGGGGGGGTPPIRPNSMAERARMAKIPPPEAPLKCPRCDSTNTKFCYFNNYSLAQPRHFCKTCRRYWTRGGALRNVPVGGGCRRNKRSSGSKSASSTTSSASASTTTSSKSLSSSLSAMAPTIPSGGFMASLHNIAQLGMGNLGLSFGGSTTGLHNSNPVLDQLDHYGSTTNSNNLNALLNHHHHHNQVANFPNFLGGFEIPGSSTTSFQNVVVGGGDDDQVVGKGMTTSISNLSSMMGVKMEDSALNIEKGLLMGISTSEMNNATSTPANNSQFWGGGNANNMWSSTITHLPGLNSSSTATTNNLI